MAEAQYADLDEQIMREKIAEIMRQQAGGAQMSTYAEPWYRKLPNDATDAIYGPDANAQQAAGVRQLLGPANPMNIPGAIHEGADVGMQGYKNGDVKSMIAGALQAGGAAWPMAGKAARSMGNAVQFKGRTGMGPDVTRELDMIANQPLGPRRSNAPEPGAAQQDQAGAGMQQDLMTQTKPGLQSSQGQSAPPSPGANGQANQMDSGQALGASYDRSVYGAQSDRVVNQLLDELAAARPAERAQMMERLDPAHLSALMQRRYTEADLPAINTRDLTSRSNETLQNLRLTEQLLRQGSAGRSVSQPAVRDSVMSLATGRPGTLAVAGTAGGAAMTQPGDQPFDREQYNRWLAEQLMQGQQ